MSMPPGLLALAFVCQAELSPYGDDVVDRDDDFFCVDPGTREKCDLWSKIAVKPMHWCGKRSLPACS
jgi:hypothetical protein